MRILKPLTSLALVSLLGACISIDGVAIGGLEQSPEDDTFKRYRCENGYKVAVTYKDTETITLSFNNGKDTYIVKANRAPAASGEYYENDAKTVTWHVKNDTGVLTYPDAQYRDTKKLWNTVCSR